MSVTVRPYRHGGWEVDIVWRSPDGVGAHANPQSL